MRRHRIHLGDDVRDLAFAIGQVVYLKLRADRLPGIVTGFHVRPTSVLYEISWGTGSETSHFDIELSAVYVPDFDLANDREGAET